MAKWTASKKFDAYIGKLEQLRDEGREIIGEAIYDGADIVADSVRFQINGLRVAQKYAKPGEEISTITSVQKKGLQDGFGISKMRKDGNLYNVKIGFAGYNGQKTKAHPNGVPNSVIARALVSGTSFRAKNDFVGRGVNAARKKAEKAIEKKFDERVKNISWN